MTDLLWGRPGQIFALDPPGRHESRPGAYTPKYSKLVVERQVPVHRPAEGKTASLASSTFEVFLVCVGYK
jgi:hypothetical protein